MLDDIAVKAFHVVPRVTLAGIHCNLRLRVLGDLRVLGCGHYVEFFFHRYQLQALLNVVKHLFLPSGEISVDDVFAGFAHQP